MLLDSVSNYEQIVDLVKLRLFIEIESDFSCVCFIYEQNKINTYIIFSKNKSSDLKQTTLKIKDFERTSK